MSNLQLWAALPMLVASVSIQAAEMPAKAGVCTSCHGQDGKGQTNIAPMLAGLSAEYLDSQIQLFLSGERKDPLMSPMAKELSDPQIRKEVTEYYASLPSYEFTNLEQRGSQADISNPYRKLVYQGDWDRNIPACATCHAASGMGVGQFPRLASQHAYYLKKQLHDWKKGVRSGDPLNMMSTIAQKLTDDEIENLSFYFASFRY